MNNHCKYCDKPKKPRHDRPGKFFTMCDEHMKEYNCRKNRETYYRHQEEYVQRARDYREQNPEKVKEAVLEYNSREEVKERKRQYMLTYRRPWRKHVKDYCEECGFKAVDTRQLDVHHKDGDRENNDPSNLETLCPPCHRLK